MTENENNNNEENNIYYKDNIYYFNNNTTIELDVNTRSLRYTKYENEKAIEILEIRLLKESDKAVNIPILALPRFLCLASTSSSTS